MTKQKDWEKDWSLLLPNMKDFIRQLLASNTKEVISNLLELQHYSTPARFMIDIEDIKQYAQSKGINLDNK